MKFKFETQPYQYDAIANICRVFKGQPYCDMLRYTRDLGIKKEKNGSIYNTKLQKLMKFLSLRSSYLFY